MSLFLEQNCRKGSVIVTSMIRVDKAERDGEGRQFCTGIEKAWVTNEDKTISSDPVQVRLVQ